MYTLRFSAHTFSKDFDCCLLKHSFIELTITLQPSELFNSGKHVAFNIGRHPVRVLVHSIYCLSCKSAYWYHVGGALDANWLYFP
jgi:hypothetical protein